MRNKWKAAFVFLASIIILSACTLQDVSDVLEAADEIITEIEKKQNEPSEAVPSSQPQNKAGSILKSKGTIAPIPAKLVRPVDGDTAVFSFDADYDGQSEEFSARFLLIDTPETRHPQLGKQPLGDQAKERTAELLENSELMIEFDIGQRLDKYGRILVYVYADGQIVQETLLEEGLARVAYVYPPNTRYLAEFEKKESIAKRKKIGIWSMEGYVTERGFNSQ